VARSPGLLFVKPGWAPDQFWIDETRGFIETSELAGSADRIAAVYCHAPLPGTARPAPWKPCFRWSVSQARGRGPNKAC
jgi:hypothetical protein